MKKYFSKLGIQAKFFAIILAVIVCICLLVTSITVAYRFERDTKQFKKTINLTTQLQAAALSYSAWAYDASAGTSLLKINSSDEKFVYAQVIDNHGREFIEYGNEEAIAGEDVIKVKAPIYWEEAGEKTKVGDAIYYFSNYYLYQQLEQIIILSIIASIFFILVFYFAIVSPLRFITNPIVEITSALKNLSQGNLNIAIPHYRFEDEITAMRDALQIFRNNEEKRRMLEKEQIVSQMLINLNKTFISIVDSLGQGFFVFDENGICGDVCSKKCEELFDIKPVGVKFTDVLNISEHNSGSLLSAIRMIFSGIHAVPFQDIAAFLPKDFSNAKDNKIKLSYSFISNDSGAINKIVVIARDVTEELRQEKIIEDQNNLSKTILALTRNRNSFFNFVSDVRQILGMMESPANIEVNQFLRDLHTCKGLAGAFSLKDMVQHIHDFEDGLGNKDTDIAKVIQEYSTILTNDINAATKTAQLIYGEDFEAKGEVRQVKVYNISRFLEALRNNNDNKLLIKEFMDNIATVSIFDYIRSLNGQLIRLAERYNKEIADIIVTGTDANILPESYKDLFASFTHILSNIIDHGIEYPDARTHLNKPAKGQVSVDVSIVTEEANKTYLRLIIADDGAGINPHKIREKLAEISSEGSWRNENDSQVIKHIFDMQFSTRGEASIVSGRGVGLAAVQNEVEFLGGSIDVESQLGSGTKFIINIPYNIL